MMQCNETKQKTISQLAQKDHKRHHSLPRQFALRKSKIKFRIAKIFILNMTIDHSVWQCRHIETIQALCLLLAKWSEANIITWPKIPFPRSGKILSAILHTEEINWGQLIGGGFGHLCWQRFRQQNSSWLLCSCRCFPSHPWTCSP